MDVVEPDRSEPDVRGRTVVWAAGTASSPSGGTRRWWTRIGLTLLAVAAVTIPTLLTFAELHAQNLAT